MSAERQLCAFPLEVFDAPVLRQLDDASRDAIRRAATIRDLDANEVLFREGDASESFFVVIDGSIEMSATRRGDDGATTLRRARVRDTFGEESTLPGLSRRATAMTTESSVVLEIPISVFRRALGRSGNNKIGEREKRYLHRAVTRDSIACSALGRLLSDENVGVLLDSASLRRVPRGERLYEVGDHADAVYLVAEGLMQLQRETGDRVTALAYLGRGDFFGDSELSGTRERDADAVASGDSWCIHIPERALHVAFEGNLRMLDRIRRVATESPDGSHGATRDLYRLKEARSLLVIDQDSCVRCGHCAWSCSQVHGESRLVRRGDHMTVALRTGPDAVKARTLSMPNTCQHCRNAACMVDCPTGAIGRDLRGEVFIREELCTGCGSCSKACPWDNISMAPSPTDASAEVAVKCDLCRGYESPACVEACPTEAILRIDPERDLLGVPGLGSGVASAVVGSSGSSSGASPAVLLLSVAGAVAIAMTGFAFAKRNAGMWQAGSGVGFAAAILAALCIALLAAYGVPKRAVKLRMRKKSRSSRPTSRARRQLLLHIAVGFVACATAMAHAGTTTPASPSGALNVAFWLAAVTGLIGGILYFVVPRRLTRIEERSALPEDLKTEKRELLDRLFKESTGRGELVKAIVGRVLVPYSRAPLGPIALLASGRTLDEERRRLRGRIDQMLESRGADRLEGLDALVKTVVDVRAAPGRRALTSALRGWLPLHIMAVATTAVLLVLHIAMVVFL